MEGELGRLGDDLPNERNRVSTLAIIFYKSDLHCARYFFTSVAFLPLLSAANRPDHTPCIINVSSISGITKTTQHHYNYNSSKAATIQLNNLLAQEFSQPGVKIRVNSIAPGIFPSQMTGEYSCFVY